MIKTILSLAYLAAIVMCAVKIVTLYLLPTDSVSKEVCAFWVICTGMWVVVAWLNSCRWGDKRWR